MKVFNTYSNLVLPTSNFRHYFPVLYLCLEIDFSPKDKIKFRGSFMIKMLNFSPPALLIRQFKEKFEVQLSEYEETCLANKPTISSRDNKRTIVQPL